MTRNPALIDEDDLMAWLGYERRAYVENWLLAKGIPWQTGKGGKLVTTLKAVERAIEGEEQEPTAVGFG